MRWKNSSACYEFDQFMMGQRGLREVLAERSCKMGLGSEKGQDSLELGEVALLHLQG